MPKPLDPDILDAFRAAAGMPTGATSCPAEWCFARLVRDAVLAHEIEVS